MLSLALLVSVAHATVFTVDDLGAAADATDSDGACRTAAGTCTLTAAMSQAAIGPGPHEIHLPAGDILVPATLGVIPGRMVTVTGAGVGVTTLIQQGVTMFQAIDSSLTLTDLTLDGRQATAATVMVEVRYERRPSWLGGVISTIARGGLIDVDVIGAQAGALAVTDINALDYGGDLTATLTRVRVIDSAGDVLRINGDYGSSADGAVTDLEVVGHAGGDVIDARYAGVIVSRFSVHDSRVDATARASDGSVSMRDGTVTNTNATYLLGVAGGPSADFGAIGFTRVEVHDSESSRCAAQTDSWAYVSIEDSQIYRNTSASSLLCGGVDVRRSVFALNTSAGDGGVIHADAYDPYTRGASDTLFYRNRTTGSGGAVWMDTSRGGTPLRLDHCTFVENVADYDRSGGSSGGGLWARGGTVRASVFYGDRNGGARDDVDATLTTHTENVVSVEAAPGSAGMGTSDHVGTPARPLDPRLSRPRLLPNGRVGVTPLPGSPLIDAASTWSTTDLSGVGRPQDGDGDGDARADIGAVEVAAP